MNPVEINISLYRRNRFDLLFRVAKDLTNYDVYFLVKADKEAGSAKIIEKISTGPTLQKSYTYPYSYLTVKILPSDTENLVNENYYYELYAVNQNDTTDLQILYCGEVTLIISVSTPTDVSESLATIYYDTLTNAQMLALGTTLGPEDEGLVVIYNTDHDTIYTWTGDGWH